MLQVTEGEAADDRRLLDCEPEPTAMICGYFEIN